MSEVECRNARQARDHLHVPLSERIALTIEEAAALIGVSENTFRAYIYPHCPKLWVGRRVLIPRRRFEKFIEGLALDEEDGTAATAAELLSSV